ncbi:MAG: cobalamin-binding protein [Acidobacteriota bacterium]|jgi:iron complex transport system substrate-binding protein|nr:cobalamin-binding protein [Acidobacteriota bacterium]
MSASTRRPHPVVKNPEILHGLILSVVAALLCLSAAGCGRQPSASGRGPAAASTEYVDYTDGIGQKVRLPRHPQRIISLAPNITETLYLLGAQDRLIGNTIQCTWPEEAKRKPKIGELLNPNYEVILAAKPDLVIASTAGNDRNAVMKLAGLGAPVYVAAPRDVEKIFQSVRDIARITDCEEQGRKLVAQMRERMDTINSRIRGLEPVRAFFITWLDPLLAPGKNTFENDVLRLVGVVSITADIPQYYPRYSLEQILVKNPDAIITVKQEGNPIPDFKKIAGWRDLRAVREGKVFILSEYIQHPSPLFLDGVEELARQLYPERFQ